MKNFIHKFGKKTLCTAVVALACAAIFVSCSGNDEFEDMLSKGTTPVTFRVEPQTSSIFFDYTEGWHYIGSDTVRNTKSVSIQQSINLHQGRHNVVMVKGVNTDAVPSVTSIHFNPDKRTFYLHSEHDGVGLYEGSGTPDLGVAMSDAYYWHQMLDVSPHILPEQQPEYTPVTATLQIIITDLNNRDIAPGQDILWSGSIKNIPVVEEVGIENDKSYTFRKQSHQFYVGLSRHGEFGIYPIITYQHITLCPLEGLNTVNLPCVVTDEHGQIVPTTPIPVFSMRRGYTTILRGPLFSGTASDWMVEMKPY